MSAIQPSLGARGASDGALVLRARAGDGAAFRALFDQHAPGVRRFLRAQLRDEEADLQVAQVAVSGSITFALDTEAADVRVEPGAEGTVRVEVHDAPPLQLKLETSAGRVEARFGGESTLPTGTVTVRVPPKTRVELSTRAGDVQIDGVGGDVKLVTVSGDTRLHRVGAVDLQTVSGEAHVEGASGEVRARTVSGDTEVESAAGPAARFDYHSTSGSVSGSGVCGAGCRLEARTVSGDVRLALAQGSGAEVRYDTKSGDFHEELGMTIVTAGPSGLQGRIGTGEGRIDVGTLSGDLVLGR